VDFTAAAAFSRSSRVPFLAESLQICHDGIESDHAPESRDKIMSAVATSEIGRVPCPHLA
jgi:hypothetical protein